MILPLLLLLMVVYLVGVLQHVSVTIPLICQVLHMPVTGCESSGITWYGVQGDVYACP